MYKFKSYDLGLVLIWFGLIAVVVKSDKTLQVIDIKSDMTILRPISEQTGNQPNSLITSIREENETADESYFQNKFESWTSSCPDGHAPTDRWDLTGGLARKCTKVFSTSLRLTGSLWGNIHGSDCLLNPGMVPTADSRFSSGDRIDLCYGRNFMLPDGGLKGLVGHRRGIVFTTVFQRLDGPQLETDWYRMVG